MTLDEMRQALASLNAEYAELQDKIKHSLQYSAEQDEKHRSDFEYCKHSISYLLKMIAREEDREEDEE